MRKPRLRFLSILMALMFTLTLALSGCGTKSEQAPKSEAPKSEAPKDAGKIPTIRFAHNWTGGNTRAVAFEPLLKKYIEDNKGKVNIVVETANSAELQTKIKVDVAGGNTPDVFNYWGTAISQPLIDAGVVLDIDEYLKASTKIKKDMIDQSAWDIFQSKGKYYGVPIQAYRGFTLVNKALFEKYGLKYPKTYADMVAMSKVFNQNGIVPFAMGSKGGNPSHTWFSEVYFQFANGQEEIKAMKDNWTFNTPNALKVAKIIDDMRKNQMFPKDTVANGEWAPQFALYNEGKAAMIFSFTWSIGAIKPEIAKVSEIIPFPKMDGAVNDPATFIGAGANHGVMINKKSFEDPAKRQAIVDFVDFMMSVEMGTALAPVGTLPVRKDIKLDATKLEPTLVKVIDNAKNLKHMTNHYENFPDPNSFNLYMNSLDELFAGAITPEQFVDKVQKSLDKAKAEKK